MARSLEARLARLEARRGAPARLAELSYAILRACYTVLSQLDGDPMPTDAELRAMAQVEALSGLPLDYMAALQAVWEETYESRASHRPA